MKAIRSLEQNIYSLDYGKYHELTDEELKEHLYRIDDRRLFCIAEAIRRGYTLEEIHAINKIDLWFLDKIANLVKMEQRLKTEPMSVELMKEAKRMEFPDKAIAEFTHQSEAEVKAYRYRNEYRCAFKMVDTCAAEF